MGACCSRRASNTKLTCEQSSVSVTTKGFLETHRDTLHWSTFPAAAPRRIWTTEQEWREEVTGGPKPVL